MGDPHEDDDEFAEDREAAATGGDDAPDDWESEADEPAPDERWSVLVQSFNDEASGLRLEFFVGPDGAPRLQLYNTERTRVVCFTFAADDGRLVKPVTVLPFGLPSPDLPTFTPD